MSEPSALLDELAMVRAMATISLPHHMRMGDRLAPSAPCWLVGCREYAHALVGLRSGHQVWLCEGHAIAALVGLPVVPWAPC